ncbi:hypothetical protein V6N13_096145 [Hibiscus sabdariffa]|uniref:Protein kinase domain-containing protein n=1 Tax=Hibiscus sabdariffa TaxID=183260 RepID=A0ABR2DGK4_9ROSI
MKRICRFIVSRALLFLILASFGISTLFTISLAATEKEILLQFKGNITDDPYNSLISWVPNGNPCVDFSGVFCNPQGFVDKIVLWNTSLSGQLPAALSGLSSLRVLTLFGNRFSGNLPQEFSLLQTLWKINVSSNELSGSIPDFVGDLPNIRFLDFSKNGFSGEISLALFKNCYKTNNALSGSVLEEISKCQSLLGLDLSRNSFTGLAPLGVLEFKNITYFNISHNKFIGEIPVIGTCSGALEFIDASWNNLSGEIPTSISNCKSLKVLDLGFNKLNGTIPVNIGGLGRLLAISLANNSLSGTIPAGFGSIELLQVFDLHNLNLAGGIPEDISNCRFLRELDFSGNMLEGHIPDKLYNMSNLEVLDFHCNRLNGSIPSSLGNLSKIQLLDLSQNSLSGSISPSLGNLNMLTHFNLSYNNLSGTIPIDQTIQSFGASAFSNNPRLCGSPLASCSGSATTSTSGRTKVLSVSAIVAAAVILTGVCVVTIMNIRARKSKKQEVAIVVESTPPGSSDSNVIIGKLVLFSKSLPSKYEDWEAGTKALLDKECLIGGGSIGTVYKTSFEGGISIAVKKLETLGRLGNQDEFEQEIGRLGNLQHRNLVAFQGYYWSSSMQLILSEFILNGNLYDNLHGMNYPGTSSGVGNTELNWSRRFHIALGTARALSYLHHDCRPPILHLNIKSTNILLDESYEAKVSDYGLGKLLPILDNYGLTKFHNAVGYVAPELAQSLRLSEKCDVYSFGVILLELVTGRKPVESPTVNEVVILCEYVRGLLERGSASACFDRRLRGFAENELIQVMKLGLICTSEVPSRRPSMAEVVQVLESIRYGIEP